MTIQGDRQEQVICAVSTPPGVGGISVIRVSGPGASDCVRKLAGFLPVQLESHRIYFGTLCTLNTKSQIDEVLISFFQQGRSYTGEETLEISCHGSPSIVATILRELIESGARAADRGEFSFRAFMNGKLDLVQAEAVLSLIESQSQKAAQQGLRQLKGGLSSDIQTIKKTLLLMGAHIEAAIDFSTEDLKTFDRDKMLELAHSAQTKMQMLTDSYSLGRLLKDGLRLSLAGRPNVGKSSLFNLLLQEDRAIVSDIAGTTRDVVDSSLLIEGIKVVASDTAGLRETSDLIERQGVKRSQDSHSNADLVAFVFDTQVGLVKEDLRILQTIWSGPCFLIGNKLDRSSDEPQARVSLIKTLEDGNIFKDGAEVKTFVQERVIFLSCLRSDDRSKLTEFLRTQLQGASLMDESVLLHARHFEALSAARSCVTLVKQGLREGQELEFLSLDIKTAVMRIQEILGERFDDQIMDFVFQQFCIGK